MGVINRLYVAPYRGLPVSYEVFENLVKDFISFGYLNPRSAILEGELDPSVQPFVSFHNLPLKPHKQQREKNIVCHFKGDDIEEFIRIMESLPFGKVNLCIYFDGFNWNNKELRESFESLGFGNARVAFYAFASPQKVYAVNAYEGSWREHVFTHYFTCEAKSAPHTIKKTILEPLFIRHFGSDYVEDCSFT